MRHTLLLLVAASLAAAQAPDEDFHVYRDGPRLHFTFFVSGIYMLMPDYATWYQPPHKPAGFSNLGGYAELAGSKSAEQNIYDNLQSFNAAREMGNEIGTHYVSHICEESNTWTTADWVSRSRSPVFSITPSPPASSPTYCSPSRPAVRIDAEVSCGNL